MPEKTNGKDKIAPLYLTVAHEIEKQLESEPLLPPTLELARRLAVSHRTIERAMKVLSGSGKIIRIPGRGSIAANACDPLDQACNSRSIGLVFPVSGYDVWKSTLAMMHACAGKSDYSLDVYLYKWDDILDERRALSQAFRNNSAMILYPNSLGNDKELIQEFNTNAKPLILFMLSFDELDVSAVVHNNFQAARELTDRLAGLGAKRIAFIHSRINLPTPKARLEGYRAALAEKKISFQPELVIDLDKTHDCASILKKLSFDAVLSGEYAILPRIGKNKLKAFFALDAFSDSSCADITAKLQTGEAAETVVNEAIDRINHSSKPKRKILINLKISRKGTV